LVFSNTVQLRGADISKIDSKLSIENYEKGDFILKQNQVSKTLKFVLSGVYRVYQLKDGMPRNSWSFAFTPLLSTFT